MSCPRSHSSSNPRLDARMILVWKQVLGGQPREDPAGPEAGGQEDERDRAGQWVGRGQGGASGQGRSQLRFTAPRISILWVGILQRELQGPEVVSTPTPSVNALQDQVGMGGKKWVFLGRPVHLIWDPSSPNTHSPSTGSLSLQSK